MIVKTPPPPPQKYESKIGRNFLFPKHTVHTALTAEKEIPNELCSTWHATQGKGFAQGEPPAFCFPAALALNLGPCPLSPVPWLLGCRVFWALEPSYTFASFLASALQDPKPQRDSTSHIIGLSICRIPRGLGRSSSRFKEQSVFLRVGELGRSGEVREARGGERWPAEGKEGRV